MVKSEGLEHTRQNKVACVCGRLSFARGQERGDTKEAVTAPRAAAEQRDAAHESWTVGGWLWFMHEASAFNSHLKWTWQKHVEVFLFCFKLRYFVTVDKRLNDLPEDSKSRIA